MIDILNQKPLLGRQINWAHPLARGLVGCWLFNEGSGNRVYDIASHKYDLDFFNTPTWIPGRNGHVVFFVKGSSQYLEISEVPVIAEPFTVTGWFRTDDTTGFGMIWCMAVAAETNERIMIQYRGDQGGDPLEVTVDGGGSANAVTSNGFSSNTWHHFCGVFASTTSRTVYLDVDIVNKGTANGARNVFTVDTMAVGRECGSTPYYFDGSVEGVKVWNRVLTEDEILQDYRNSNAIFEQNRVRWFSIPAIITDGQVVRLRAIEKY